jgi:hypothetical protein
MKIRYLLALAALLLVSSAPVHANAVAEWNLIATRLAMSEDRPSVASSQALAMVHVTMFEVLNFIERRYASQYFVQPAAPVEVSRPAAVAAAAHFMLVEFYPHRKPALDDMLRASLARIPPGSSGLSSGEIQGRALAANLYALRAQIVGGETRPNGTPHGALSWNPVIAEIAAARRLGLIETARLHALVSTTVLRAYGAEPRHACTPCVADTAVHTVLSAELGSPPAGARIGKGALAQWAPLEADPPVR